MIRFSHKGDFKNTEKFFEKSLKRDYLKILDRYAQEGVKALAAATPIDTGKTAASWKYEIKQFKSGVSINWTNSNIQNGTAIALVIQYGHVLPNGAYVKGRDYINPAIRPILDKLAENVWEEVRP